MEFGIFDHIDASGMPPYEFYQQRLKLIERYDAAGFYAYHCAEHHLSQIGMVASPNVFLSAVAQRTRRLRFGPLVYAVPLYHPLRLVEEICLLDQMSGGRLELGFGRGSSEFENAYFGQDYDKARQVYAEVLDIVLDSLKNCSFSIPGRPSTYQDIPFLVEPFQKPHPPIWYGVHSLESAERAGRQGLHLVSVDPAADTREYALVHRAAWSEQNGDAPPPRVGISRFVVIDEDKEKALEIARRAYLRWNDSFTKTARRHGHVSTRPRAATFDLMIEQGKAIAGDPQTVATALARDVDEALADYLVGQFAFGDMSLEEAETSVDLFAQYVMPAVRDRVDTRPKLSAVR